MSCSPYFARAIAYTKKFQEMVEGTIADLNYVPNVSAEDAKDSLHFLQMKLNK